MLVFLRRKPAGRPPLERRTAFQALLGILLGLGVSFSCGKGGGGGGLSCPPSTGIDCSQCLPGENLYACAIQSTNNTICAIDDVTADQHCALLNSIVQSKTICVTGTGENGGEGPGGEGAEGADETGAKDRAPRRSKKNPGPAEARP